MVDGLKYVELCDIKIDEVRELSGDVPRFVVKPAAASASRIHLSPSESTRVQEGMGRFKSSLIGLASGSLAWRLFLGSGVAVFIGAVTLIFLGPTPPTPTSTHSKTGKKTVRQVQASTETPTTAEISAVRSPIQLTVNATEDPPGQAPAEYVDPFIPENQVHGHNVHALHLVKQGDPAEQNVIRQVSRSRRVSAGPARLAGTIETNDEPPSVPALNPTRSR